MLSLHDCGLFIIHVLQCTCAQSPWLCLIHYTCATVYMCSVSMAVFYSLYMCYSVHVLSLHDSVLFIVFSSMGGMTVTDKPYQCSTCERAFIRKQDIDRHRCVTVLVENISYCDLVCHLWQRSIIQWVVFFQGSRCVCVCVSVCVCVCGVVVVTVWCVVVVSHTQAVFHLVFHLPPTSPTSPLSCDWVPGIYWVANSRPFLMKQQWSRWDFGCLHHLL